LNLRKLKKGRHRSRLAASEVMGAVIMLGVTITVGFAAWAWARNAASASEKGFAGAIQTNIDCLNENFVITSVNFSSSASKLNLVTVWYFDNGQGGVTIASLSISNTTNAYTFTTTQASTTIATGTGTQNQAGQAIIAVPSTSGFSAGQKVELNTQGPRQEDLYISSVGATTITFTSNLAYTHPVGDIVIAPVFSQGQVSQQLYTLPASFGNFHLGSLYTFSATAKCQGDIVSNFQQVR
jgi:hypothetical protein